MPSAVTPQSFVATIAADGRWPSLLLAQNPNTAGVMQRLEFIDVAPLLQRVFEMSRLFLVITQWPPTSQTSWPTIFAGDIGIQGWPFIIDIGKQSAAGSYANVLIFKFCSGTVASLVANPRRWTHAEDFNDTRNNGLTAASSWLQRYIADASVTPAGNAYEYFNQAVNDENWTGILALKVDIDHDTLPPEIRSRLAGIDLSRFGAHHLGIEVNAVERKPGVPPELAITPNTSFFELIDYVDEAYAQALATGVSPESPVPAAPGLDHVMVLVLRVVFQNTQITGFHSKTQVRLNQWIPDPASRLRFSAGRNLNDWIVLDGVLQTHGTINRYEFNWHGDAGY